MATQPLSTSGIGYDPFTFDVFITQPGPNGLQTVAPPAPAAPPDEPEPTSAPAPAHHTAKHK